jgi:hypothetical protein
MLGRLPITQEPGHPRRIAAEPTSGRVRPRGRPVHPAVDRWRRSPPSALSNVWALRRRCHPRVPAPSSALGRSWAGAFAPVRALCPAGPDSLPTAPRELKSFSFFLFSAFSPLIITSQYFMHQKLSN